MRLQRRGMSLVEAILSVVIFVVIAAGILVSMLMGNRSYVVNDAVVHVQEEVRRAFDSMVTELREAGGAVAVTGGGSGLEFQLALGYNLAAPCLASAVCWGARDLNGVNQALWLIRYRLNGTQLIREVLNNANPRVVQSTRVLANDVSSVAFTYNTNIVRVQLQIRDTRPQLPGGGLNAGVVPIVTQVRLRNAG